MSDKEKERLVISCFIGIAFGIAYFAFVMWVTDGFDKEDFATQYAEQNCPNKVRWENDTFYCLDENGNWIRQ